MIKRIIDIIVVVICTILFFVHNLIDYINDYLVFVPNIPESYFSERKWRKRLGKFYKSQK